MLELNLKARASIPTAEERNPTKQPVKKEVDPDWWIPVAGRLVQAGVNATDAINIARRCIYYTNNPVEDHRPNLILMNGFSWKSSKEGYFFWKNIHDSFLQENYKINLGPMP